MFAWASVDNLVFKKNSQFVDMTNPRGYSWEFLLGVCCPVLQILILFRTKKCHFPHPFSDLAFRHKLCHH